MGFSLAFGYSIVDTHDNPACMLFKKLDPIFIERIFYWVQLFLIDACDMENYLDDLNFLEFQLFTRHTCVLVFGPIIAKAIRRVLSETLLGPYH